MSILEITFWFCILAVFYNYVGYPIVLFCLSLISQAKADFHYLLYRRNRRCFASTHYVPSVAMIISAYNEEAVIRDKVNNCIRLDYPKDRFEVWFGLDAPKDSTPEVLKQAANDRVRIVEFANRRGKLAVLTDLARQTSAEILVFTDANTMLNQNCIRNLVRHFGDAKVGAVSGEEIRTTVQGSDPGGESIYWRYESAIKILESRINCSQGGNGALLAIRRSLFHPKADSIVEDFQIPLALRFQGHRVVYDPEAIATEELAPTLPAQFARRIRIGAGNYQTLFGNVSYLSPLKGLLAFTFISHRVLRWLTPFFLVIALALSVALINQTRFAVLAGMQSIFYSSALLGYALKKKQMHISLLAAPLHFCSMNLALLLGLCAYITGRQGVTWTSTPRHVGVQNGQLTHMDTPSEARQAA